MRDGQKKKRALLLSDLDFVSFCFNPLQDCGALQLSFVRDHSWTDQAGRDRDGDHKGCCVGCIVAGRPTRPAFWLKSSHQLHCG